MNRLRTGRGVGVVLTAVALLAAACGDDGDGGDGAAEAADDGDLPECPVDALDEAVEDGGGPVEITLWHGLQDILETTFADLTDEFNASQDEVRVNVVSHPRSGDLMQSVISGMTTGDLPDAAIITDVEQQLAMDTGLILPVEACVEAAGFDMSDFLPQAVDYYTVEGVLQAMPFNIASPLLFYNRTVFEGAGLDPDDPPETLEELHETAQAIVDAGYDSGFALHRYGWYFEQLMALAGESYFDNGNGREDRASSALFDNEMGLEIFTTFSEMLADGSAVSFPGRGPIDHLLALGESQVGMTVQSSSALGGVYEALFVEGQYEGTEFDVAPLPTPDPDADGGVVIGGGAAYILAGLEPDPVAQAAAWRFIEFLSTTESAAEWAAHTGYVPVRESAVEQPVLRDRWEEAPFFVVPYEQLLAGAANEATAGGLHAQMEEVRMAIEEAWRQMDVDGLPPDAALRAAAAEANQILEDYNSRV